MTGIPKPPAAADLAAGLRALFAADGFGAPALRRAVRALHGEADAFEARYLAALAGSDVPPPACAAGCAHCCHSVVGLLPPEVFALAEAIDRHPERARAEALVAAVIDHARRHGRKTAAARIGERIACALLSPAGLMCRVHPVRPLVCRAMNSTDAAACRVALEDGRTDLALPTHLALHRFVQAAYDGFAEVLREHGVTTAPVELAGGLALAWTLENAEARWLAGEDVFAQARAVPLAGVPVPRL